MKETLFHFGPFQVCGWNILLIGIILLVTFIIRKIIQRFLRNYLIGATIRIEGRRIALLKLLGQVIYAVGAYLALISLNINNEEVSFKEFLDYEFIHFKRLKLSFENILSVIVIYFGARVLVNFTQIYLHRRFQRDENYDRGTEYVYMKVARYIIFTLAFFVSLNALDVEPSIFLGSSAAILVGLGLGIQDVFKDMFSGFVLLFEGTIKVGDVIEFSDANSGEPIVAKILEISVRTTRIETRDGNVLIVPNAKLTQEYVENWSHGTTLSRFRINVTVAYNTDTQLVSDLLIQAAMLHPKVKKSEPVQVRLTNFGDNGLNMELIFWADQSWDINQYKSEIRFEIDRLFRQYHIQIPYPQRTIHVKSEY